MDGRVRPTHAAVAGRCAAAARQSAGSSASRRASCGARDRRPARRHRATDRSGCGGAAAPAWSQAGGDPVQREPHALRPSAVARGRRPGAISADRRLTSTRSCQSRRSAASPSSRTPARRTWRSGGGRKVGTLRHLGMLQLSSRVRTSTREKAVPSSRATTRLIETCYRFHNNSRGRAQYRRRLLVPQTGANLRMTEFQAALLMTQMTRLEAQARTRDDNAGLFDRSAEADSRHHAGAHVRRLHAQRVSPLHVPLRSGGILRLAARGVPQGAQRRGRPGLQRVLAAQQGAISGRCALRAADFRRSTRKPARSWREQNRCPQNERLCSEAIWMGQTMLLGPRQDMEDIAAAVRKVQAHAVSLAREGSA